ncbi:MAG TPA: SIR2 family protein [Gaiellaceae bacterium]
MSPLLGGPPAAQITVGQTLALLDGPHAAVAREVANGRYVVWLGSGISRGRVDGLDGVVQRVLEFLRQQALLEGAGSPHERALDAALDLAELRQPERDRIDLAQPVASWTDLDVLVRSLVGKYAELLDIHVDGKPTDYLLWDAVDVSATYGRSADPDCEHLAIAVLVLEGVLTEAPTANWDGLIESALTQLADPAAQVQVVVLEQDLRGPAGILRLIKFHGCAVRATNDPATYREALVGRASQISDWPNANETAAIRGELVSLATTKPTLTIGLSLQDHNIKAIFSQARARMSWHWPSNPPAHVFSGDSLSRDQLEILKFVYRDDYEGNEAAIAASALIRAFGSQLLTALVLHVAAAKLQTYIATCEAPFLEAADRVALGEGITALRARAAVHADGDRRSFVRRLIEMQTRVLSLFRSGAEPPNPPHRYRPIGNQPVSHIAVEPGLETNGMRELAAALGLIGRQADASGWTIDFAATARGHRGAMRVVTAGGESAVFFAANGRVGIELENSGATPIDSDDVIVIHSMGPVERLPRSPHASLGRTGRASARCVDMATLLRDATDLPDLAQRFRLEAAL